MTWKTEIIAAARKLSRRTFESDLGVGIEFSDASDAFWILPGEVISTFPCEADHEFDIAKTLAEYERIDRLRNDAIHIIRQHLHAQRSFPNINPSGEWNVEQEGSTTTIQVGAFTTAALRDDGTLAAAMEAVFGNSWIKGPSPEEIAKYLSLAPLAHIADALAENPFFLPGLLTTERRADGMDEPGMLMAEEFLLLWSKLSPSEFLARLIATAQSIDLPALAELAAKRAIDNNPKLNRDLTLVKTVIRNWKEQSDVAMAIAWTRCRRVIAWQT